MWAFTLICMVATGLAAFVGGFFVGCDFTRERLLKQLREQRRQNVGEQPWFPGRGHS